MASVEGCEITIPWKVEPGSDLEARIRVFSAGDNPEPGTGRLLWVTGLAQGEKAAKEAAKKLQVTSGLTTYGLLLPFGHVVARASNVWRALDYLLRDALPQVADALPDTDLPVSYGGHSRGGAPAVIASATHGCEATAALSPLGANNRALGVSALRGFTLARRLASTGWQSRGDAGMPGLFATGLSEFREMGLRAPVAIGYAVSNHLQGWFVGSARTICEEGRPIAVFSPCQDLVFKGNEYARMEAEAGFSGVVRSVPGHHATMEGEVGQGQLEEVGTWLCNALAPKP